MKDKKYSIGQKVAFKAVVEHRAQMDIMQEIADSLGVTVRTVYNYINISFVSSTEIPDTKLQIIAQCLGCTVPELVDSPAAASLPA